MSPLELVALLAVLVAGVVVLEAAIRRSDVGAGLLLGYLVVETGLGLGLALQVGGFNVFGSDLVAVVLLTAAVARLLRGGSLTGAQWLLLAIGLLVVLSIARGVALFGLATAVNEGRRYLRLVAAVLYFSTVEPRREVFDRLAWWWIGTAAVFGGLTLVRWVGLLAGLSGGIFGERGDLRVFGAAIALLVMQGALIAAFGWWQGGERRLGLLALALLPFVVLLQHRTVWISLAVVVAVVFVRDPRVARRLALTLGLVTVAAVVAFSVLFEPVASESVGGDLGAAAGSTVTFEWRYLGWAALLADRSVTVEANVIGEPFGSGWERDVAGRHVDVSPHNFYLEVFLRLGLVGVALLFGMHVWVLWRLARARDPGGLFGNGVLFVLVVSQLVYYVTQVSPIQGVLLGLAVSAASAAPRTAPVPARFAQPAWSDR